MVNLTIDGRALQAKKGSTILDVARENGIFIPTLCYHQALHPIGSCRICVVEVKPGPPRPLPACATYVNEGMEVTTLFPSGLNAALRTASSCPLSTAICACDSGPKFAPSYPRTRSPRAFHPG